MPALGQPLTPKPPKPLNPHTLSPYKQSLKFPCNFVNPQPIPELKALPTICLRTPFPLPPPPPSPSPPLPPPKKNKNRTKEKKLKKMTEIGNNISIVAPTGRMFFWVSNANWSLPVPSDRLRPERAHGLLTENDRVSRGHGGCARRHVLLLECAREGLGFRVQGSGFRVQGSGFRDTEVPESCCLRLKHGTLDRFV